MYLSIVTLDCEHYLRTHTMTKEKLYKLSLEEEVETLHKHMGVVLATRKDLKQTVEALGGKVSKNENEEIKEIIETQ